jgi:hypothetical protein
MNSDSRSASKTRTITLTGRRPVKIVESEWPVLTQAREVLDERDGKDLPPYERSSWLLVVRQHGDRRALVYGVAHAPPTRCSPEDATDWRGGDLLDPCNDIDAAIQRVGEQLVRYGGAPEAIVRRCLGNLPAEQI